MWKKFLKHWYICFENVNAEVWIFVEIMQNGGIGPWMQLMGFDKVKINKTNISKQNSVFPEIDSESEG